jgi:hypothetical protein
MILDVDRAPDIELVVGVLAGALADQNRTVDSGIAAVGGPGQGHERIAVQIIVGVLLDGLVRRDFSAMESCGKTL